MSVLRVDMSAVDGLPEWLPTVVSSFVACFLVDLFFHRVRGVETVAFLHSLVVSIGATAFVAQHGLDVKTFLCNPNPAPLATVLPMVTGGYAGFDLFVGLQRGRMDYTLHGLALLFVCVSVFVLNQAHTIVYALLMEWSTVFLNLRGAKKGWIDALFVVSFVGTRLLFVPAAWGYWLYLYYLAPAGTVDAGCVPNTMPYVVVAGGFLFHGLNAYWGCIIVSRLGAKLFGEGNKDRKV